MNFPVCQCLATLLVLLGPAHDGLMSPSLDPSGALTPHPESGKIANKTVVGYLKERHGEEEDRCVDMSSCSMAGITCNGTDPGGSVAPVGVSRLCPSIAVPDPILHSITLHR